jgi:hypothetical protein
VSALLLAAMHGSVICAEVARPKWSVWVDLLGANMHDAKEHATVQRAVGQADSGMSQVVGVGGVGKVAAIGAYHDLEGSIRG